MKNMISSILSNSIKRKQLNNSLIDPSKGGRCDLLDGSYTVIPCKREWRGYLRNGDEYGARVMVGRVGKANTLSQQLPRRGKDPPRHPPSRVPPRVGNSRIYRWVTAELGDQQQALGCSSSGNYLIVPLGQESSPGDGGTSQIAVPTDSTSQANVTKQLMQMRITCGMSGFEKKYVREVPVPVGDNWLAWSAKTRQLNNRGGNTLRMSGCMCSKSFG
ncbi:hypothetical protein Tco_0053414 [Tanacetum coccineum]